MIKKCGIMIETTPKQAAALEVALKNSIVSSMNEDECGDFIKHLFHVCLGAIVTNEGSAYAEKYFNELLNKIEFEIVSEAESKETTH